MDKQTLSNYGWITICVLVIAVMVALASPFGTYVRTAVENTAEGLYNTEKEALGVAGLKVPKQSFHTFTEIFENSVNGQDRPDFFTYGDYEYGYNKRYSANSHTWDDMTSQNGWGVRVIDTSKTSYGDILETAYGEPVVNMTNTFYNCTSLTVAPTIPKYVTNINGTFNTCTSLETAPEIPSSVTEMYATFCNCTLLVVAPEIPNSVKDLRYTFASCTSLTDLSDFVIPNGVTSMAATFCECISLTTAPVIPSNVTSLLCTFAGCTSLTGTIIINSNGTEVGCFSDTILPITLTGSSSRLSYFAGTSDNGNVTVA